MNRRYTHTDGQYVGKQFFTGDEPQANRLLAPRINGHFTGTTKEILRWAACKWGIDQNLVFAQAAVESWWRQTTKGDWESSGCPPGHGPGVDGRKGLCPQSWGILQNRYPYEKSSWPGIDRSTAMNADTAYAIWRSCYDGYETWLNTVPHVGRYHAGDAWAAWAAGSPGAGTPPRPGATSPRSGPTCARRSGPSRTSRSRKPGGASRLEVGQPADILD
ncbi:MAG: hypothetical protein ACRDNF_24485, partial [Streptosporangiaceae bacterium]